VKLRTETQYNTASPVGEEYVSRKLKCYR